MNRRAFLAGLFSSAAAISVAAPIVRIIPTVSIDELLRIRMDAAYKILARQLVENLYGDSAQTSGGLHELFE